MAGNRPPSEGERPPLQSVSRGRRSSWRTTAVILVAVALALAYVGRFGLPDLSGPAASPSARPTRLAVSPTPTSSSAGERPTAPAQPTDAAEPTPIIGPAPTRRPPTSGASRYPDGIPARIGDERVLTVDEAVALDRRSGAAVLVGGWHRDGRLRDRIGGSGFRAIRVEGVGGIHGPVVVRASFATSDSDALEASEVVWTGDLQTAAEPIAVMPLLDALVASFSEREPSALDPVSLGLAQVALDCPIAWPRHTYAAAHGPVHLALVFNSPADRVLAESDVIRSQYPSHSFQGADPGCPYPAPNLRGRSRWLVDGNVMLLIRGGQHNARMARNAIEEARREADLPERPWRLISGWQALRSLWRVYPGVDVAPPAEQVFCAPDLPEDSWSVRHRYVRGLALFPSTAEREEFQQAVPATDVRLERGACSGLAGQRPIEPDARWIGVANVLVLVTGPAQIDAVIERELPLRTEVAWP